MRGFFLLRSGARWKFRVTEGPLAVNVADLFPGFVPDHDAQMVPGGFASRQVFCNQIGVVHRRLIVIEVFRGVLRSNGDALFKGEGVAGALG